MGEAMGPGFVDALRIVAALAVVSGLVVACGYLLRRGAGGRRSGRRLSVEERLSIARGTQLVIVGVGSRRLLVGVSEKGVNLVSELESAPVAEDAAEAADGGDVPTSVGPIDFARVLAQRLRSRSDH